MKRIILHWTAGKYQPNQCDLEHYHYLVGAEGEIYEGKFKVEDNEVCRGNSYGWDLKMNIMPEIIRLRLFNLKEQ